MAVRSFFGGCGLVVAAERDAQVFADAAGEELFDVVVHRHHAAGPGLGVAVESVRPFALPDTIAVVGLEVAEKDLFLHAVTRTLR